MAKNKEKNEITAEELIGKLGNGNQSAKSTMRTEKIHVTDLTSEGMKDSDSDLDISELLHKYLPEYEEAELKGELDSLDVNGESSVNVSEVLFGEDSDDKFIEQLKFGDNPKAETADEMAEDDEKSSSLSDEVFSEYDLSENELPEDSESDDVVNEQLGIAESEMVEVDEKVEDEVGESEKTRRFLSSLMSDVTENTEQSELQIDDEQQIENTDETNDEFKASGALFTKAEETQTEDWEKEYEDETGVDRATEEVDPTDINLMIAFDIDAKDEETANRAKELGDKLETKHKFTSKKQFILDRPEYVDKSQTSGIRAEFKKKKASVSIRAFICAICVVALFVFENITTITRLFTGHAQQFTGVVDPALYPVVYIMVSLQITLIACLCAVPEIIDGVRSLFKGSPKTSTLTALLAVAAIVYSAILCNVIKSPNEPALFGFVVAVSALLTLIGEKLNIKRESMNFRVIAGKKPKNVVRRLDDEESETESSAFPSSDRGCDVMKIEKTDFISNFFTRLRKPDRATGTVMTFVMCVSVAAGILFGIFANFRSNANAASVVRIIFETIFLLAPASVQLAFSYPFYRANRAASEYDSAIIGDVSLDEYSNASIISFDDKSVFPSYSVKVQNIRIYNNARIDRVLYYASSVFAYAGGPLQDVFEIATKDMGISDNVKIFDSEEGFLATQVDGVNIIFGNYNELTSRGLEIPDNAAEDDVDFSDDLSIMYMFRESKLVAKMYIKYDMDEDIDTILKQFSGDGLYVCVRTFDPNIDEYMIAQKLGVKRAPLKVVRYVSPEEVGKFEEKVDSGLVTSSSAKSLLQVVSYCEKVKHSRKMNTAFAVLSMVISVAIMLLSVISGAESSLSSFVIALYQLVWIIPMIISSKVFIR